MQRCMFIMWFHVEVYVYACSVCGTETGPVHGGGLMLSDGDMCAHGSSAEQEAA
jgi:hypothetical protein